MPCDRLPDLLAPHDVSGGTRLRSLPLVLDVGDAITVAVVTAVDAETKEPLVGDTLNIFGDAAGSTTTLTWGLTGSSTTSDTWSVNLYLRDGSVGIYTLQLRYRLASQPGADQYDELYRVEAVA